MVVVGILIALQVNTWNNELKSGNTELILLKEFEIALNNDLQSLRFEYSTHLEAKESCDYLLEIFSKDLGFDDSMARHFSRSNYYTVFRFKNGAYESLKSMGIEMNSNLELAFKTVNLYDKWYNIYITNHVERTIKEVLKELKNIIEFEKQCRHPIFF